MKDKKGFSLIELLATIVILSLIAMITMPMIMDTVEEAKKRQFLENVKSIVDAIDHYNSEYAMKAIGQYVVEGNEVRYVEHKKFDSNIVYFKGTFDGHGYTYLNKDGVTDVRLENSKWCVYGSSKDYKIKDGTCEENNILPIVETPSALTPPTYAIDKTGWQTKKTVTITYPERTGAIDYEYSLDGGNTFLTVAASKRIQTVTFESKGSVIARIYDGNEYITAGTFYVDQIDSTPPTALASVVNKSSNTVSLKAYCNDNETGISKIEFSKDNGKTFINNGKKNKYTFKNLNKETYHFKVRCTNGVNNKTISNAVNATTVLVAAPTYTVNQTGWQKSKVVTITYPERQREFVYQYSLDFGRTWQTVAKDLLTQELEFTSNGSVIARILDGTTYVTSSTFVVTQVDNISPTIMVSSYEPSVPGILNYYTQDVKVNLNYIDDVSGVDGYQYAISKDGGQTYSRWSNLQKRNSFKVTTEGTNIIAKVRVKDIAGNISEPIYTKLMRIDKSKPNYTTAEIKNINETGYDVYIHGVKDDGSGINRVQFPTYTELGGKDDIQQNWSTSLSARGEDLGNGSWNYHVDVKDHMNEGGLYTTQIYIYDNVGNYTVVTPSSTKITTQSQLGSLNLKSGKDQFNGHTLHEVGSTAYVYNNATFEFDATPTKSISMYKTDTDLVSEWKKDSFKQNFLIMDLSSDKGNDVGYGVSIGTNGVMVIAHKKNYYHCVLGYQSNLRSSHKYRIVMENKIPYLYIDNRLVASGIEAPNITGNVLFTRSVGRGSYGGNFEGSANHFNLYSYARK